MKKLMVLMGVVGFLFLIGASGAVADTMMYDYTATVNKTIGSDHTTPSTGDWVTLNFPDGAGTYSNGTFEYDTYAPNNVQALTITMNGQDDATNSSNNIDVFIRFGTTGSGTKIASFNPADGYTTYSPFWPLNPTWHAEPFTFTADILHGTASWTQDGTTHSLANLPSSVNLSSFIGQDSFQIGAACDFYETTATVHVGVNNTVPEPMSLLFFGMGLLGVVTFRRGFKK